MDDIISYLSSFAPVIPMLTLFYFNFGFARFFHRHQKHKKREMICLIGTCCSLTCVVIAMILVLYQHLILYVILGILIVISIFAIFCHFYYYIVERPVPLNMVEYKELELDEVIPPYLFNKYKKK